MPAEHTSEADVRRLLDSGADDDDSAEILDHCRSPGRHVRGCFVIDLVLGAE